MSIARRISTGTPHDAPGAGHTIKKGATQTGGVLRGARRVSRLSYRMLPLGIAIPILILCVTGCGSGGSGRVLPCGSASPGSFQVLNLETLVAGMPGEILLAYRSGLRGMQAGDTLRLELPTAWYTRHSCPSTENLTRYQSRAPDQANYFGVLDGGAANRFSYSTVVDRRLDGRPSRFKSILEIHLEEGELAAGEEITLLIRGWNDGQDFKVPEAGGSGWIHGEFVPGSVAFSSAQIEPARLSVQAGPPAELFVALPSVGQIGERLTLKMRLLDKYYNPCPVWDDAVTFEVPEHVEGIPVQMSPDDLNSFEGGLITLDFRIAAPGSYKVRAYTAGLETAESNPVYISAGTVEERLFWGDLHAHSEVSKDGMGEEPFRYARDVSLLDFFALTDHHTNEDGPFARSTLLPAGDWEAIQQDVSDYYEPGAFVTLLAYENSAASPSGHQNVYFPTAVGPLLPGGQLDETWQAVRFDGASVIQHHPGIIWHDRELPEFLSRLYALFVEGSWVYWGAYAGVPRPALEVYSLHGQSEYYNPLDSLSYENCGLGLPREGRLQNCKTGISKRGPHYARNAWARGLRLGAVAGSDDHRAQPGRAGAGLTAVWAGSLTREDIFAAINDRRTYATTGDRIILDFRINGAPMGSETTIKGFPKITVGVVGTAEVDSLQIMRYQLGTGPWEVLLDVRGQPREFNISVEDTSFSSDTLYYVRLQQTNETHGRPVRAWSSPIWVRPAS
ncbi:MAG: DUF3604 domain-containing protein [Armatimonadota bacterium]|nr:DUF3604 domain-containing protein [Armatimonadota bacterium]